MVQGKRLVWLAHDICVACREATSRSIGTQPITLNAQSLVSNFAPVVGINLAPAHSYAWEHCACLTSPLLFVLIISRLPSLNVLVNMLHSSRTARMRQLATLMLNKDDRSPAGALLVRQPEPTQATQASRGRGRDVELQGRDYWADAAYLFSYLNARKTAHNCTCHA
jgi:hypothetical protein